jgi:hypothetical protein
LEEYNIWWINLKSVKCFTQHVSYRLIFTMICHDLSRKINYNLSCDKIFLMKFLLICHFLVAAKRL